MSANTNVALLSPEPTSLAHLSDAELLTHTRSLVGRSNRLLADLLAHLGEVEARRLVPPAPTWEQFACSLNPVRQLEAGERPREWGLEDEVPESCLADPGMGMTRAGSAQTADAEPPGPARAGRDELGDSAPERFKVEFTATEEYVRLVQEARALLSHRAPRLTLEQVYLRAMRTFVETLRKHKYGSKEPAGTTTDDAIVSEGRGMTAGRGHASPHGDNQPAANLTGSGPTLSKPRQRGRHIPAAIRRVVAARDHHRCTYVDASGKRCAETQRLEFHHIVPFAICHLHAVANLTLRCQAHNALAAEEDFGRDVIEDIKSAVRHDSFSKQGP